MADQKVIKDEDVTLSEITRSVTKTLFGRVLTPDRKDVERTMGQNEQNYKDLGEDAYKKACAVRTFTLEFDFANVAIGELVDMHLSTTTLYKKYYNDHLFNIEDENLIDNYGQQTITVSVREMLDSPKRRIADPSKVQDKAIKAYIKRGLSKDQILEEISAKLSELV